MAHRVRAHTPQDGDLADPADWRETIAMFAGEANGNLDRDNLPEGAVTTDMLLNYASRVIFTDQNDSGSVQTVEGKSTAWTKHDNAGAELDAVTFTLNADALVRVCWSGTWTLTNLIVRADAEVRLFAVRIMLDGYEIGRIHKSSNFRRWDSGYCHGSRVLGAGKHKAWIEVKQWRSDQENATEVNVDLYERELTVRPRKR